MSAIRQDAWTDDEDLLLAETVLRHIREGSTQLAAFEEVGKTLSRTPAACGFRWNSLIRKRYENAINLAKKQRKELSKKNKGSNKRKERPFVKLVETTGSEETDSDINLNQVIGFLQKLDQTQPTNEANQEEIHQLKLENDTLKAEKATLLKENQQLRKEFVMMKDDYQALIHIMERARRFSEPQSPKNDSDWEEVTEALSVHSKED